MPRGNDSERVLGDRQLAARLVLFAALLFAVGALIRTDSVTAATTVGDKAERHAADRAKSSPREFRRARAWARAHHRHLQGLAARDPQIAEEAAANRHLSVSGEADPDRPNILVVITDDQGVRTLPAMLKTKRIFKDGIIFRHAFGTTPVCGPSRAAMLTGQYSHNTGIMLNRGASFFQEETWINHPRKQGEFLRVQQMPWTRGVQCDLHRNGYRNAIFGKYLNGWYNRANGNPRGRAPSCFSPVDSWMGFDRNHGGTNRGFKDRPYTVPGSDEFLGQKTSEFIRRANDPKRPWFAYLALHSPHLPFNPARRYRDWEPPPRMSRLRPNQLPYKLSDKPPAVRRAAGMFAPGKRAGKARQTAIGQLRMVRSVDDVMAQLWRTLKSTGQAEDTIIIFTSDNGFSWGEHGIFNKFFPYMSSSRIPMMVRAPGLIETPRQNKSKLVANIDIAPTIYDATGIEPAFHEVDGHSMLSQHRREWLLNETGRSGVTPYWSAMIRWNGHYIETAHLDQSGGTEQWGIPNGPEDIGFREYYPLNRYRGLEMKNRLLQPNPPATEEMAHALRRAAWKPGPKGQIGCAGTNPENPNPCP